MKPITARISQFVLRRVFANYGPETISRSGDRGRQVNCYYVRYQTNKDDGYLVKETSERGLIGFKWNGDKFDGPLILAWPDIDQGNIVVERYLGLFQRNYTGLIDWIAFGWTGLSDLSIRAHGLFQGAKQSLFNASQLRRKQRIDILRASINYYLEARHPFIATHLMGHLHGDLWVGHPGWQHANKEVSLILELLCDGGELTRINHAYKPNANTFKIVDEYDNSERRHRDNRRTQTMIALLTFALVLAAALEANLVILPTLLDLSR